MYGKMCQSSQPILFDRQCNKIVGSKMLLSVKHDRLMGGRRNGWTDVLTDRRMDRRTYALYLLGVSQVTKFMNFDIKIFFDKLIPYCKSKCCAKIQLSIFIASHRNNYLENIFLYRVL